MKKATKILLSVSLAFFILGFAFCIVSLCLGFRPSQLAEAVNSGKLTIAGPSGWTEQVEKAASGVTGERTDFEETYSGIEKLELEIGAVECRIIPYDSDVWTVNGSSLPSGFTCRKNGEKLKIDCSGYSWKLWKTSTGGGSVEIYIPASEWLEDVEISAGAGEIRTDGFIRCRKLELDCGIGSCDISADISKKAKIKGGVGEIHLVLAGEEEDFDYDISCGIGEITIGESHYSELGGDYKTDNDSGKEVKVECGVGSVTIGFSQ
ncbi:MAG: hypothetical protein SOX32_13395 [Candidatus Choladocola sp.]|nr:hypothetical protein [Candidatus Choladocola sp.]